MNPLRFGRIFAKNTGAASGSGGAIVNTGNMLVFGPLGRREPAAFLSLDDYFAPQLREDLLFHHRAPLMGRQQEADMVVAALTEPDGPIMVIIEGPPGCGKSRLALDVLRRIAQSTQPAVRRWRMWLTPRSRSSTAAPSRQVALVYTSTEPMNAETIADLPSEPTTLLVDIGRPDAADISALLQHAKRTEGLRLLLTATPAAAEAIHTTALQTRLDTGDLRRVPLAPLSRTSGRALVAALHDNDLSLPAQFAEYLATAAQEAPYVAVIAIALIRQHQMTPVELSLNDTFIDEIMLRYRTAMTTGMPDLDPAQVRELLALCTALSPVDLTDDAVIEAAATFRSASRGQLIHDLQTLVNHGAIVQRGTTLRVLPEVFADRILYEQAIQLGVSTGYLLRVWNHFRHLTPNNLLRNLAYLDWRIRRRTTSAIQTGFEEAWADYSAEILAADAAGRNNAFSVVADVAATQPQRALDLVRDVLADQSADAIIDDGLFQYPVSNAVVAHNAGPILRTCAAVEPRLLPDALDTLWAVARTDDRPPNQDGHHPARLLEDIAALGNRNALHTNAVVLDRVSAWLNTPDTPQAPRTPISVLPPILAKDGYHQLWEPDAIGLQSYTVNAAAVGPLRDRARAILRDTAAGTDIRRAVEAATLLGDALTPPHPGRAGTEDEERRAWLADDLATIDVLDHLAATATEPLIRLVIRHAAAWQITHAAGHTVRRRCETLIEVLDDHTEDILTDTLLGFDAIDTVEPRGRRGELHASDHAHTPIGLQQSSSSLNGEPVSAIEKMLDRQRQDRIHAAQKLWASDDPTTLIAKISERTATIAAARATTTDSLNRGLEDLLTAVAHQRPASVADIITAIAATTEPVLHQTIHVALNQLATHDPTRFVSQLRTLLAASPTIAAGALAGFSRHAWTTRMPASAEVLRDALNHPNQQIANIAVSGVGELLRTDPQQLQERLIEQAGTQPWPVIAALDSATRFDADTWIAQLDDNQRRALLEIVFAIEAIWPYSINRIVIAIAARLPLEVLRKLSQRYHRRNPPLRAFDGLPAVFAGHGSEIATWLRETSVNDDHTTWYLARLLPHIAGQPMTAASLQAVQDITAQQDPDHLEFLCRSLSHCQGFALDHPHHVDDLLAATQHFDPSIRDTCRRALQDSTTPNGYFSSADQPPAELIEIRDRATNLAATPDLNSPLRDFYTEIAAHWQAVIDRDRAENSTET